MTGGEIINTMNYAKSALLTQLVKDGLLTKEQAKEYDETHVFVFRMMGWWGKTIEKIMPAESKTHIHYHLVKIETTDTTDTIEEIPTDRFDGI